MALGHSSLAQLMELERLLLFNLPKKIIVLDFSGDVTKGIQEMEKAIEGLDIAITLVTMVVLPGMIRRRKDVIVNMGSGASIVVPSHPLYTIYAATKAFDSCAGLLVMGRFPGLRLTTSLVLPRRPGGNSTGPSTLLPGTRFFNPMDRNSICGAVNSTGTVREQYGDKQTVFAGW
ncbi:hypothetical protein RND71_003269 [Anisodus tanguticus]|uniref:Uncharacterized protein n=1 Tax=Anisodus tanguticus TaxID=243964 RepID=A0AAE1VNJ9_9SOLA|nr:hypothetical protein RND71_003269 [Anisodus tanguticus]